MSADRFDKPIWTTEDLAEFLGLSIHTIYRERAMGKMAPAYKIGRHLRWKRDDVLKWLEEHRDPD